MATDYSTEALVKLAGDFEASIAGHIARTKRLIGECEAWNTQRRRMLEAYLSAFEKLAGAHPAQR